MVLRLLESYRPLVHLWPFQLQRTIAWVGLNLLLEAPGILRQPRNTSTWSDRCVADQCDHGVARLQVVVKNITTHQVEFFLTVDLLQRAKILEMGSSYKTSLFKKLYCARLSLSKPVIALSSSAKVIFFYLSAMTPNNLRKAGSHIRGEIKRSVFRKKLEWLNKSALTMVIHELKNLGTAKHNW